MEKKNNINTPDLLPKSHKEKTFKVNFDLYTPRAHLIVLFNDAEHKKRCYDTLLQEEKKNLIDAASAVVKEYKLTNKSILSLHRGSWADAPHFHAHVCVDVEGYLKVFNEKKVDINNMKHFVTKNWRHDKNPEKYEENARRYPYKSYRGDEIDRIDKPTNKPGEIKEDVFDAGFEEAFTLVYHPDEPRIGFQHEDGVVESYKVLETMNEFARKYGMADNGAKGDDNGCHICLLLNPEPKERSKHGFTERIQGYIQMTGPKFIALCPKEIRYQWFENFRTKGKVMT